MKTKQGATSYAELLEDPPQTERPAPFGEIEHDFPGPEALRGCLGDPEPKTNNRHGNAWEL
ncbi:hypothetical protein [Microvirga zambiensis]|uniref:hypothetical protein n=1 Tax=Microvirga zambiensis TaxID=1402137 RepID=UPI001FE6BC51|nr:hypothetical protein [Microvirga zambiensis]